MRTPIAILSFNRPQFLEPMLTSLRDQRGGLLEDREIHLFQDGAVNRYSRLRYAKDEEVAESVRVFRRLFPQGEVHASADNIGICENFRRAERFIFEERGADCGYFFEDDLVLSPAYLEMLERLRAWADTKDNVAYFAAYGNYYAGREEIAERRRELMTLDHHWAFGLLRRHWEKMQPLLEPFYRIVTGNDYARRDHRAVFALYEAGDAAPRASSQDAAKAFACDRLGLWRTNTVVPFARYIGSTGQHMTPAAFDAIGFNRTVASADPVRDLEFPDQAWIAARIAEQHALFQEIRQVELPGIVSALPPLKLNPTRLTTRADVEWSYRLLLRRRVESEQIFAAHVNRRPVFSLVQGILASTEFRESVNGTVSPIPFREAAFNPECSREDIVKMYALCLHREPEEAIIKEHVGKSPVDDVLRGILSSAEFRGISTRLELRN